MDLFIINNNDYSCVINTPLENFDLNIYSFKLACEFFIWLVYVLIKNWLTSAF